MTLGWFFLLFNVDRIFESLHFDSFLYVLCAVVGVAIVAVRSFSGASPIRLGGFSLVILLALKAVMGAGIVGRDLPQTALEMCVIGVTIWLARGMTQTIARFEKAASKMLISQQGGPPDAPDQSHGEILTEIRRARRFNRPLSLVTLAPTEASLKESADRFIEEIHRETIDRYVAGRFAGLLAEETHDYDIIARRNNHFVLLLPETDGARAGQVVARISAAARERLGLEVIAGTVEFPAEEITLTGLLERAEERMKSQPKVRDERPHVHQSLRAEAS
jgi:hypothetical protein